MAIEAALGNPIRAIFDAASKDESQIKMLQDQHESSVREQKNMENS